MGAMGACASLLMLFSCNNDGKDSVEKADSINRAERQRLEEDSIRRANQPDEASSKFLVRAANSGMTEVMMSQAAIERSTRQPVKDVAQMLVSDHRAANDQVKSLAQQRNVALPDSISDESRKDYNDIVAKRGTDFDKKYVNQMIDNHEKSIKMFEDVLNDTQDAGVRNFAQNTLPKLRQHLDMLKQVKDGIK